jgi:cell wall-associated NlpC family hydrolase
LIGVIFMEVSMIIVASDADARVLEYARERVGKSTYRGSAKLADAPSVFNCFRFTQWLWLKVGVNLPDHQLMWPHGVSVAVRDIRSADLVFVPRFDYTLETDDFGHVGIASGERTVIHATKWKNGVVEDELEAFLSRGCLGIRRVPYICRSL